MSISVFELFKIGIGPSSSHTMGPWKACRRFVQSLGDTGQLGDVTGVEVVLYGSLAKTGTGHGTDKAVQLGLMDKDAERIDPFAIPDILEAVEGSKRLSLGGQHPVDFDPQTDILYERDKALEYHANAMTLRAHLESGRTVEETYYSVGGGFIVKEGEESLSDGKEEAPFPATTGEELLAHCRQHGLAISEVVHRNEQTWNDDTYIDARLHAIWDVMKACAHRGCHADEGELPGGLHVRRRAGRINRKLMTKANVDEAAGRESPEKWVEVIRGAAGDFQNIIKWISCFALAVNEENATFGRVVTAPTNGAAGVIPAVMLYYRCFCGGTEEEVRRFLMTAGQVGILFKHRATISAAMGGCQAEIGVSSAMASAGLTECQGGSPEQALMAAEIAMEHHLGMTCDPVGGLVQIPCIERNTMGAVKAVTASNLALESDPGHARVSLDAVIDTMWQTAQDMNSKYKETSEGGLAANIPVSITEC